MNVPAELIQAAQLLQPIDNQLVFVGGAVAPLYYQRPEYHGEERPTIDVDCVIEVASYVTLQGVLQQMRDLGFSEGREQTDPICRWRGHGLVLDLVPLDPNVLGFSNRWYSAGWANLKTVEIGADMAIELLPYGVYMATKLEAFSQRGQDPRMSHDLEDVFLTMAARADLIQDARQLDPSVRNFLASVFKSLLTGRHAEELIAVHLPSIGDDTAEMRIRRFINRLIQE